MPRPESFMPTPWLCGSIGLERVPHAEPLPGIVFRAMPSLGVPRPNLLGGDFTEPAATEQGHVAH